MKEPKQLADWQIADATRLKALFAEKSNGVSQTLFAAEHGIGSQGMIWQYMAGRTPLNIEAAVKFARGLGCAIDEFSPTLAAKVSEAYGLTVAGRDHWPAGIDPSVFSRLSDDQKFRIAGIAEGMVLSAPLPRDPAPSRPNSTVEGLTDSDYDGLSAMKERLARLASGKETHDTDTGRKGGKRK